MKTFLCLVLIAASAYGQYAPTLPATNYPALDQFLLTRSGWAAGSALPATCTPGAEIFLLTSPLTPEICTAANSWSALNVYNNGFQTYFPNATPVQIVSGSVATGDVVLGTVPAGKRWYIGGFRLLGNTNSYAEAKIGGNWYRLITSPASGSVSASVGIILEAGQQLGINSVTSPTSVNVQVLQFDATSNLKSFVLTAPASGNNTLFTVPSGHAYLVAGAGSINALTGPGQFSFVTDAGGTRNVAQYVNAVQVNNTATIPVSSRGLQGFEVSFVAGDSCIFNVDVGNAAQIAWVNILDFH